MTVPIPSELKSLVGNVAVITTIIQFMSGALVCKQYVVNKTTAEASPLPFLFGLMSTSLWLLYGATKNDDKVVLVNTIGLLLMGSYMIVFYTYTFKKSFLKKQILGCAVFGLIVMGYISVEEDNERLLDMLGSGACYLTLITVAAPLSKLYHVIKVKNTECLPFPMILMSFIVSLLWLSYGFLDHDVYMTTPNLIGSMLALGQLLLFVIFPNKPNKSVSLVKSMVA